MSNAKLVYFFVVLTLIVAGVLNVRTKAPKVIKYKFYYWCAIILILSVNIIAYLVSAQTEWFSLLFFMAYYISLAISVQKPND